jgi:UDP-N-acetylglucosamine--N-acetylmuramyl-(pentapeptide) pyrophosphoryl-undecaprenol N-acetylglucosamine transferase
MHTEQKCTLRPVLVMAGGTGGHVFPALAVARELQSIGLPVVWMGTRTGLEARIVPEAGIPMEWISVSGLRGKRLGRLFKAPFMLMIAAWQSMRVIMRRKPLVVLGMGGFVTGPGGVMGRLLGKPLCIHEQNACAGMTNRWLSRIATRVMEAFPGSFSHHASSYQPDTEVTGNPVRKEIAALAEPDERFAERSGALRLLVLGGSLGAQALNTVMPEALALIRQEQRPQVRHQAGKNNFEQAQVDYQRSGVEAEVTPFIEDMAEAYGWADLVLCRAGALTVSELAAAGVGSILVPFPYAVDDHQTANARFLEQAGAGVLVPQQELTAPRLAELLSGLSGNKGRLLEMAQSSRKLACPEATHRVAELCLQATGLDFSAGIPVTACLESRSGGERS